MTSLLVLLRQVRKKWVTFNAYNGQHSGGSEDVKGFILFYFTIFFPQRRLLTTLTNLLPCSTTWHKLQGAIPAASD